MAIIKEQRRYIERRYKTTIIRKLFDIPKDEMISDLLWDKNNNVIVVKTLCEHNKDEGDI